MRLHKLIFLLLICTSINAQVLNSKFDTKNHPKAKGVWATVRYPTEWEAKEGERPNIVKKFSGYYKGIFVMLALQIKDAGEPIEQECTGMSTSEFSSALTEGETDIKLNNMKKTRHEEKPGFIYEMSYSSERAGKTLSNYSKVMMICNKKAMIFMNCSGMKIDKQNQTFTSTRRELLEVEPMCFQFFNSLVVMDKY